MVKRALVILMSFVIAFCAFFFGYSFIMKTIYPQKYEKEILFASKKYLVEPHIIASMINVESSFNEQAISSKGAVGLMQILPQTALWLCEEMEIENFEEGLLTDPQTNILMGTYYLRYLMSKFQNLTVVFCSYNAGEGTVRSWLNDQKYSLDGVTLTKIPYIETKNHVDKLERNLKVYYYRFKNVSN